MQSKFNTAPVGWVLFHDLGYSPASLMPIEEALGDMGARVVIASLPGQGEIAEAYRDIHAHDLIRAARRQTLELMGECGRICLFGHGMGALLALQMAEELPVKGAVLAAPTLALPTKYALFSGWISHFRPYLPHGDDTEADAIRDRGIPTVALGTVRELASRVVSDVSGVRCRVRVLVPEGDNWSDPETARRLAEAIPHGKAAVLQGACHQCLTGEEMETLLRTVKRMQHYASGEDQHA